MGCSQSSKPTLKDCGSFITAESCHSDKKIMDSIVTLNSCNSFISSNNCSKYFPPITAESCTKFITADSCSKFVPKCPAPLPCPTIVCPAPAPCPSHESCPTQKPCPVQTSCPTLKTCPDCSNISKDSITTNYNDVDNTAPAKKIVTDKKIITLSDMKIITGYDSKSPTTATKNIPSNTSTDQPIKQGNVNATASLLVVPAVTKIATDVTKTIPYVILTRLADLSISNMAEKSCLSVDNNQKVYVTKCNTKQPSTITWITDNVNNTTHLIHLGSNKCLDTTNGTVHLNQCDDKNIHQQWQTLDNHNSIIFKQNATTSLTSGRCLENDGSQNVFLNTCNGNNNQSWIPIK